MYSLLLVTAMSAVADTPNYAPQSAPTGAAKVANRAYFPVADHSDYFQSASQFYAVPTVGFAGCGCYCPSEDADLFLPCAPAAPCPVNIFPSAPRGVTLRVNVHTPPPQVRVCPPAPPRTKAPCP